MNITQNRISIYLYIYIVEIDHSSKQELHIQGCHVEIKTTTAQLKKKNI